MDIPSLIIIAYFFLTLLVSFLCRRRNTELQRLLVAPQQLGLVLTVPLIFSGLWTTIFSISSFTVEASSSCKSEYLSAS